jgi:hypothetical protein
MILKRYPWVALLCLIFLMGATNSGEVVDAEQGVSNEQYIDEEIRLVVRPRRLRWVS